MSGGLSLDSTAKIQSTDSIRLIRPRGQTDRPYFALAGTRSEQMCSECAAFGTDKWDYG
jgi:hypothetical protein